MIFIKIFFDIWLVQKVTNNKKRGWQDSDDSGQNSMALAKFSGINQADSSQILPDSGTLASHWIPATTTKIRHSYQISTILAGIWQLWHISTSFATGRNLAITNSSGSGDDAICRQHCSEFGQCCRILVNVDQIYFMPK
jgi:hypothetical protein